MGISFVSRCLLCFLCVSASGAAGGAEYSQQAPPRFTARTEVVRLDVGVLDGRRRPLKGLIADDFVVSVDGVPQSIVAVTEVTVAGQEPLPSAWRDGLGSQVASNDIEDARTFLIIIDDVLIRSQREVVSAQKIARSIVDSLGPSDVAAVVFSRDNRHAQDFTRDKSLLRAAIATVKGGESALDGALRSLNVLRNAAQVMAGLPARRNSIAYITPGPRLTPREIGGMTAPEGDVSPVERLEALTRDGALANVRIYPFSPSGLSVEVGKLSHNALLRDIAHRTGGRAAVDDNAPEKQVAQMMAENEVYYVVGFTPTYPPGDGRARRLTVAVKRRGATVLPSTRYFEAEKVGDRPPAGGGVAPVRSALSGLLPETGLPLSALVDVGGPATDVASGLVGMSVRLRIGEPRNGATLREGERFEIETRVFDGEGRKEIEARNVVTQAVMLTAGSLELSDELALGPGRYNVRVAVRRLADGHMGAVYTTVRVPNYAPGGVTMSDLRVLAGGRSFGTAITLRRTFAPGEPLAISVDIHAGAQASVTRSELQFKVEDTKGVVVDARSEGWLPRAPGGGTRRFDLDTTTWGAGSYLVTVILRRSDGPVVRTLVVNMAR